MRGTWFLAMNREINVIIITFLGTLRVNSIQPRKLSTKNNCLVPVETWPGMLLAYCVDPHLYSKKSDIKQGWTFEVNLSNNF